MSSAALIVGRDADIESVVAHVRGRSDHGGTGAVVVGPSGVGRTTVVRAAAAHLHGAPVQTAPGRVVVLPASGTAHLAGSGGRRRALPSTVGPCDLVVIDDLHLVAPDDAALIRRWFLADHARLLVSLPDGEEPPDILRAGVMPLLHRQRLNPLGRPEIDALAEALADVPLDARTRRHLHVLAKGLPRRVLQVVDHARRMGSIERAGGLGAATWIDGDAAAVRAGFADVAARLDAVDPATLDLMLLVALAGQIPVEAVPGSIPPTTSRRALADGMLRIDHHGLLGIDPVDAAVLLRTVTDDHRQRVVREALDRGIDLDANAMARLYDAVGADGPAALRTYLEVLRALPSDRDPACTAHLARRAIALGGPLWLHRRLAECSCVLAGGDEVLRLLETLPPDAPEDVVDGVAASAAISLAMQFGRSEQARALVTDRPYHGAVRLVARTNEVLVRGPVVFSPAPDPDGRAADAPTQLIDADAVEGGAAWTAVFALGIAGRGDEAAALAERALGHETAGPRRFDHERRFVVYRAVAEVLAGRLGAGSVLEASWDDVVATEHPLHIGNHSFALARLHEQRGELADAVRMNRESAAAYSAAGRPAFAAYGRSSAAWCLAVLGRTGDAVAELAAARELDTAMEQPMPLLGAERTIHAAVVHRLRSAGRDGDAVAELERAARDAAATGEQLAELAAWWHLRHDLDGRRRTAARDGVRRLSRTVQGPVPLARCRHLLALWKGDDDAVLRAAEDLEAAGALLLAAVAMDDAGVLATNAGRARAAATAARHARALAQRCGAEPRVLQHPRDRADELVRRGLTARELDVATLLAAGHRRTEVAARLVLSTRTVDSHVQRIYAKLGVSSQGELAAVLGVPATDARGADR